MTDFYPPEPTVSSGGARAMRSITWTEGDVTLTDEDLTSGDVYITAVDWEDGDHTLNLPMTGNTASIGTTVYVDTRAQAYNLIGDTFTVSSAYDPFISAVADTQEIGVLITLRYTGTVWLIVDTSAYFAYQRELGAIYEPETNDILFWDGSGIANRSIGSLLGANQTQLAGGWKFVTYPTITTDHMVIVTQVCTGNLVGDVWTPDAVAEFFTVSRPITTDSVSPVTGFIITSSNPTSTATVQYIVTKP